MNNSDQEFFDTLFDRLDCTIQRYLKMGVRLCYDPGYSAPIVNGIWSLRSNANGSIKEAHPLDVALFKRRVVYSFVGYDIAYYWGLDRTRMNSLYDGINGYEIGATNTMRGRYNAVGLRIRNKHRKAIVDGIYPSYNPNLRLSDIEV